MARMYFKSEDLNQDGLDDAIVLYSMDFNEPLPGDYRGVIITIIPFVAGQEDGRRRAEEIARITMNALLKIS